MKKILLICICLIFLVGCSNEPKYKKLMEENKHIIIDVRTKEEYDELHISGAINIPLNELDKNNKFDKNKIIFVYCRSGNRSRTAYNLLKNLGYTVYDLGGIDNIDLEKE